MGKVIPMEDRRINLREYEGSDQVRSAVEVYNDLQKASRDVVSYQSGLPGIDYHTEGFAPGELICISGPTKNGKTLLAQTFTKNFYIQGIISLWFSYEVPARQFVKQFGNDIPLMYMPSTLKPSDLNWLEDRVIEAIEKYNIKVVFIDHLHFLFDMMASKNTSLQIGQVIRKLKQMAIALNLVVFLMAHTNKVDPNGEISHFQIRDSSFISQESDSVFMIRRDMKIKTDSWVSVEFHRRTGVLRELVKLRKQGYFLIEPDDQRKEPSKDWHDQF